MNKIIFLTAFYISQESGIKKFIKLLINKYPKNTY